MSSSPNILLITADQLRWDCLGCMGNSVIQTPHLDKLASRGVLFRNGFTPNPICVPARASIMTGNYPQVCTGHKRNTGRIKDDQPLMTEVLKSVGYRTYALGKLHFVPYSQPGEPRLVHGFEHVDLHESGRILGKYDKKGELDGVEDYFDYLKTVEWGKYSRAHGVGNNDVRPCPSPMPAEHHVDYWIADCTIRQIDRHKTEFSNRPFFMWMSSPKPHAPYDPPRPYDNMYDPREIPAPFGTAKNLEDRNPHLLRERITHAADSMSPEAWQVARSYYYGLISFFDAQIGRVVEHLESNDLLDNTIILFASDHGDMIGDFETCFKLNHLNGSVRVPFIAAGPGISQGKVSETFVGLQDIMPTFAAAAGADIGQDVQGINLMPHLNDTGIPVRDHYFATTRSEGNSAMIINKHWKYIYSEENGTEELYYIGEDPNELVNLANDPKKVKRVSVMREKLEKIARELKDDELFDAEGKLKERTVDLDEIRNLPVKGMGWRWY